MKIAILDVYPFFNHRLIKDTAGGYGTGNDFGNSFFSKILNFFVDNMIGMPPINIMYIESILNDFETFYTRDVKHKFIEDCDFVILSSSIIAHETEIKALEELTKLKKKVFVVGIFANILPNKYHVGNSVIIKQEAENYFLQLKNQGNLNKDYLDKLFTNNDCLIDGGFVDDLDSLPYPKWNDYFKRFPLRNNFLAYNADIAIPILATRGCPYSCFQYCTYPLQQGRKVRAREPKKIVDEILFWKNKYNIKKFVFRDPVFSINRKHTVELCNLIISANIKIKFLIETHLNNLDDELMTLLRKAGLEMVYVGIESSNVSVLKDIKRFTIEKDKQYEVIKKLTDLGISVKSMFMIGNPGDTKETIINTMLYANFLPHQLVQYSVFTPYPGTPVYPSFEKLITEKKLENFNQYNLVFSHSNLTKIEILELKKKAYLKFYINFRNILKIFFTVFKSKFS
jgi:radical SAM superfamily enzyme YgiQ (UPF0313 family)